MKKIIVFTGGAHDRIFNSMLNGDQSVDVNMTYEEFHQNYNRVLYVAKK